MYLERLQHSKDATFGKLYETERYDSIPSGVMYQFPKHSIDEFFELDNIKRNINYIKGLSRFERELLTFYWSKYEHVIAIADNLDSRLQGIMTRIFANAPEIEWVLDCQYADCQKWDQSRHIRSPFPCSAIPLFPAYSPAALTT